MANNNIIIICIIMVISKLISFFIAIAINKESCIINVYMATFFIMHK